MTPEELLGRSLLDGEYVLQEVLGRGGMATVYRAHCRSLGTDVAVKVLAPRLAGDPGFRERFHDEARSLAPLHHPNLIEVHRYGEEGDLVFIAMRLVEGGTLKQLAQAMQAPLDIVTTARLISQVADALQLAHEENLIHLDIKPGNILLGRHDWPVWPLLADFGITQAIRHQETRSGGERLAGTPLYMSPEQCVGGPIDGRSDEYSLAVTTFELLTGRMPFVAETTEMLLQQHVVEPPPRVREVNPAVPSTVEDVVMRGLAKNPDDRYPTVREFGQALTVAAERARGVSLETKSALSAVAPNLIAAVALLIAGPLILTLLPDGAVIGARLPLLWPFQFTLGLMLTALLWGIRWHLIGLLTRATNAGLEAVLQAGGLGSSRRDSAGPQRVKAWRNAIVGSVEGLVRLGYLIVFYRLLAVPALMILATLSPGPIDQTVSLVVAVVVVVLAVGIVASIYRSSGPVIAGLLLAVGWAIASTIPASDLALFGGASEIAVAKLLVGIVIVLGVLTLRRSMRVVVAQMAVAALGPLLTVAQPGATREQAEEGRRHLGRLAEGILDFGYLLLGYTLLQAPLVTTLKQPLGVLPAAVLVTGVAGLIWAFLTLRLRWIAGTPGAALGVMLGAPLLTSLPLFQPRTLGLDWPAVVATWVVALALILLVAMIHGQVQAVGQRALGPVLDRGMAGTNAAPTEAQADRRARALGDLAGAVVSVLLLILGYWIVGLPAVATLSQASGRRDLGTIALAGVVLGALALLAGPLRRALLALEETGGSSSAGRYAALPGVAVALAALLVGGCAAVPAMLTSPAAVGDLALAPPQVPVVQVVWQHYAPWTPTQDQAAYAVSLACSDGRVLGVFQEAFRPATGVAMPSGNVGKLGLTETPCSNWASTYFGLRQAAGLPAQSSVSWDAVDLRAALQPDGSADVVETHAVLFTYGAYGKLAWPEATGGIQGELTDVGVAEGGSPYQNGSAGSASTYFRVDAANGQSQIGWWFPSVASPAIRTYTIHYHLKGAIQPYEGGQEFARLVILPNRAGPVWRMTVEVTLPNAPAGQVEISSSGTPTRDGMVDSRTAWFEAQNIPVGSQLGILVKIPGGLGQTALGSPSSPPTPPTGTPPAGSTGTTTGGGLAAGSGTGAGNAGTGGATSATGASGDATNPNVVAQQQTATAQAGTNPQSAGAASGSGLNATPVDPTAAAQTATAIASSPDALTATAVASSPSALTATAVAPSPSALTATAIASSPGALTATAIASSPGALTATAVASAPGGTSTAPAGAFTPTPTATPGSGATTATAVPVPTDTPTSGGSGQPTSTPTAALFDTPTPTPVGSSVVTSTPTSVGTSAATSTPTIVRTSTMTATPTLAATSTATSTSTPTPSIILQSTSITPQSPLTVSGSHFQPNHVINLTIDGKSLSRYGINSTCATNSAGSFSCGFLFPPLPAGNHVLTASDGTNSVSLSVTVVGGLSLNPTSGFDGTAVTATGYGFGANQSVSFTFSSGSTSKGVAPGQCTSDANGSFVCNFHVPVGTTNGVAGTPYTVTAMDGTNSATAIFTVTAQN